VGILHGKAEDDSDQPSEERAHDHQELAVTTRRSVHRSLQG
jgi:hypothetical protein